MINSSNSDLLITNSTDYNQIVKFPIITDKTTQLLEKNQYSFIVDRYSDKNSIKKAIEYFFTVKVVKLNTCYLPLQKKRVGKFTGFRPRYKKAIVTLSEGDVINLFTAN